MQNLPALVYDEWRESLDTLHLWTQIVGKVRLKREPLVNHWWNVTLYVTPRGLTTSTMPAPNGGQFEISFDFVSHELRVDDCNGAQRAFALRPMSVAAFYERLMQELRAIGVDVRINTKPNEVPDAIPFESDTVHASYDPRYVERFLHALLFADRLCKAFRARFLGKASPVHFFWGSFDLATARFSGRRAPPHPGGVANMPDWATREAYSHEDHSVGFWPGGFGLEALFYAYAYPEPAGFAQAAVTPATAAWNATLKEFVLPYEAVRTSANPGGAVLDFFQATYDAEATLAHWDPALERPPEIA
jgi:hypothetical protein